MHIFSSDVLMMKRRDSFLQKEEAADLVGGQVLVGERALRTDDPRPQCKEAGDLEAEFPVRIVEDEWTNGRINDLDAVRVGTL